MGGQRTGRSELWRAHIDFASDVDCVDKRSGGEGEDKNGTEEHGERSLVVSMSLG